MCEEHDNPADFLLDTIGFEEKSLKGRMIDVIFLKERKLYVISRTCNDHFFPHKDNISLVRE